MHPCCILHTCCIFNHSGTKTEAKSWRLPSLDTITYFPALFIYFLSATGARHRVHVFPRLAPVTCFLALGTGYMFSRAWHRLHVFPRLAPVTYFLALGTGYMFSRAWHRLHVFSRLAPVTCFLALGTGYMFSRAWHRLHVFSRLPPVVFTSSYDWFVMFFAILLVNS